MIIFKNEDDLKSYDLKKQKVNFKCGICGKIDQKRFDYLKKNKVFKCKQCQAKYARSKVDLSKIDFKKRNQKSKETCLKKYGVESSNSLQWKKDKIKKSNLEKYGCHPSQLKEVKNKQAETNIKKYGFKAASQNENVKQKFKDNCEKKYGKGITNPFQAILIKEKSIQTCLEKYNVENPMQSKEIQKKAENTCLEKYGFKSSAQNPEVKEKLKETLSERTKEVWKEIRRKSHYKYDYFNQKFDSGWELELYIFLKDTHINFVYQPDIYFEYEYEGKIHRYFPDFEIDGKFYEIKGDQFLKEDGKWQNPFDHGKDDLYEAKHQCLLKNNVIILTYNDLKDVKKYIEKNYPKDYIKSFKKGEKKNDS